jgi:hypothetical protein
LSITSEINFPWSGIDRKTGAAFAEDAWGNIFVIHRGKIGGGKKGIGKSFFEQSYRGVWSLMEDGDCITQVAVIGALNSPRLALQIAHFVKKIEIMKSAATHSPQTEIDFPEITFREDLVGCPPALEEPDIDARCDHDLVINNMAALLHRWKLKIGNDSIHELFLVEPSEKRKSHVFAVLTDANKKNVLAAAAKLLLQTIGDGGDPAPILILPEDKMINYVPMLGKLGISVIGFCLEGDRIIFPNLGKIRLDQNLQL